ncbi:neuropeptide Y receptor type 4-like [Hydractinia symbiolongicarpus]|uniref:neuropeptide Y receptor type 4-like n=1 Tax=Hydractinia symbiolongicarpus TaxID=13093 RepID=UPI00254F82C5|nr:neuropeptide Y receptor type 4-like [Hydractinia symbiolongicarpus]XP_057298885.1 neuropeptide Y receptor type 4-like [Hydractinia symbiolongicarpus]XP_057298886.1 neuropeptide Y receptor type 4-like [Hydractinia symbiolongicarpus]
MYCDAVRPPTELSIFTATISSIITLLSVIGNGIIIFVVIRDPLQNLRTPFNFFLVNLAFSDLIIGLITSPLSVYGHARESVGKLNEDIKIMFQLPYFVSITASILNLGVLCADRFTAIIYPIKHRIHFSLKKCVFIAVGIWLFSVTVPFIYFKVGFVEYLLIYANTCVLLAFIFMCLTYVKVYKFLRQKTTELRLLMTTEESSDEKFRLKRLLMEKKVTRAFLVILVLFICTYLPASIMIYIIYFCQHCDCTFIHILRDLEIVFILSNSCMNPFVCTIRLVNFKKSIKALFSSEVNETPCSNKT